MMMSTKYLRILSGYASCCLLLNACTDLTESPARMETSVNCVLVANRGAQKIFIYSTTDRNTYIYPENNYALLAIAGAVVDLTTADGKHRLQYVVDTVGVTSSNGNRYYSAAGKVRIVTDAEYGLSVETSFGTITGSTRVPGEFTIGFPVDKSRIAFSGNQATLPIHWTRSTNAFVYQIVATMVSWETRTFNGMDPFTLRREEVRTFSTVDTAFSAILSLRSQSNLPDTVIVEVTAFDKNFYSHKFLGNERAGVTGGYGVIGSGVAKSITLTVQK